MSTTHYTAAFVPPFSSVDLQVVKVVQHGAQSPAWLHVVHFLGQLGMGGKKNTQKLFVFIKIKKWKFCCRISFESLSGVMSIICPNYSLNLTLSGHLFENIAVGRRSDETASPAARCSPWSQTHPWADKWCTSSPYTGRECQAGTWSSYCTLSRQKRKSWLLAWIISHLYSAEGRVSDNKEESRPDYWNANSVSSTDLS